MRFDGLDAQVQLFCDLASGNATADQGRGFSKQFVTTRTAADRFEQGHSRGLTLIESLMDEVSYNSHGNEMTMHKHSPS